MFLIRSTCLSFTDLFYSCAPCGIILCRNQTKVTIVNLSLPREGLCVDNNTPFHVHKVTHIPTKSCPVTVQNLPQLCPETRQEGCDFVPLSSHDKQTKPINKYYLFEATPFSIVLSFCHRGETALCFIFFLQICIPVCSKKYSQRQISHFCMFSYPCAFY